VSKSFALLQSEKRQQLCHRMAIPITAAARPDRVHFAFINDIEAQTVNGEWFDTILDLARIQAGSCSLIVGT
jgi:hypothetical protein